MFTYRTRTARLLTVLTAVAGLALSASAGPEDQFTKYPVGIGIGGQTVSGIVDSGGTTTLSFEDAKKLGLLDKDGNPTKAPDGSQKLGGTGGGSVDCHKFNKVKIKVQPKNADGSNNGDPKEIEVTVFVPKKPADQTGTDEEKAKKTGSVVSKVGANVAGATIDGSKLELKDKATDNAEKNERSTGWAAVVAQDHMEIPYSCDPNFEDNLVQPSQIGQYRLNGMPMNGPITLAPITIMPMQLAQQIGIHPEGTITLGRESQNMMWIDSFFDVFYEVQPMSLPWGHANVTLIGIDGDTIEVPNVRVCMNPDPRFTRVILGCNGLIPADHHATLDNGAHVIRLAANTCPADVNGDGFVNGDDYDAYVQLFLEGDPRADYNGDGFVNGDDFDEFVADFENGC